MIHDTRRSIFVYWVLLIVPTLILGAAGLRLLGHEKDRIRAQSVASLADRAGALAESLELTVAAVEEALTRSLMAIDPVRLRETLRDRQETHPLVRNVFVWTEGRLDYPVDSPESTAEERRFIQRYEALFSGRLAWDFDAGVGQDEQAAGGGVNKAPAPSSYRKDLRRITSARRDLLELAGDGPAVSQEPRAADVAMGEPRSGWIPWFAENQLFILGWVQMDPKGPVYGIELETMSLLSRLLTQLPALTDRHAAYGLVSGQGRLLFQSGAFPVDLNQKPVISVPLSGLLPHYRIVFYLSESGLSPGRGLIVLGGMLLGLTAVALITGGALLIQDSRRSLKDAMEKTSFVSSVSHELKTPLTSIRMYAELLRDGRVTAPEKIAHYLSVIVTESQRLTRLVNNVLDFGKLEQGRKTYQHSSFDLKEMLQTVIDVHGVRLKDAGLRVHTALPEGPLPLVSDRDALEQVLLNLLDNAVKYAATGEWLAVELDGTAEQPVSEIRIRDRGPGIPPDHRARIFEKFHRVDHSLTAGQAGSGLGLSIARRIMRDLGGDLLYQPEEGSGSCFRVRIKR